MTMPGWLCVRAVNCLQNSMMLRPWGPRDRPPPPPRSPILDPSLVRPQLQVIQLHARRPAEQTDRHPDLALVRQDFFHLSAEVRERTLDDLHHLADQEREDRQS